MKQAIVFLVLLGACSKHVDQCHMDSDCSDPAFPFCDVNGEYSESGGEKDVCTVTPPECPPERCGCTPGASTCADQMLSVCDPGGMTATTTECVLGCSADGSRCATFAPSNGLGDALAMAAAEDDVDFPAVVNIDDAGDINQDQTGLAIPVKSFLVQQVGVPAIRVYVARSFKIHDAFVFTTKSTLSNPIAFVATGSITFDGNFNAAVETRFFGPGGQPTAAPCTGEDGGRGGGGGGNGTVGARGAQKAQLPPAPGAMGGPAQPANVFEPLVGGCAGGASGDGINFGGQGGSGLEFVSGTQITVAASGMINVAGQGGADDSGGGSGGNILLEAPLVSLAGRVVANGASGGACGMPGNDGTLDSTPAARVGGCMSMTGNQPAYSGAGGTGSQDPVDGQADTGALPGGGGGGAVGRLEIKTTDGTFVQGAGAIVSAKLSASALVPK